MARKKLKAWAVSGFPVEMFVKAKNKRRARELIVKKVKQRLRMKELV